MTEDNDDEFSVNDDFPLVSDELEFMDWLQSKKENAQDDVNRRVKYNKSNKRYYLGKMDAYEKVIKKIQEEWFDE